MDKVKIGFLGVGFMGQLAHLQNYVRIADCEVAAVCDAKPNLAKKVAEMYNIPKVYETKEELLADKEIIAVVASQQYSLHVDLIPQILLSGKHVFTEKPLSVFADNGQKIIDASIKSGKLHMVGYHKRSDLASEYAVNIINKWKSSGEMGKMKYIRISMPPGDWVGGSKMPYSTNESFPPSNWESGPGKFSDKEYKKYNEFVNYYIHQVNFMRYLLNEDYKLTFADRSGILIVTESDSGICGAIEMAAYQTSDDWQESALITFEKGWILIELPAPLAHQTPGKVTVFTDNGSGGLYTIPRLANKHAMLNQAENFIKAVKGEIPPKCNSADAKKDLLIAEDYIEYIKRYE